MSEQLENIIDNREGFYNKIQNSSFFKLLSLAPVIAMFSAIIINIIYYLRVDTVIGQFGDDAWYIVLARSIAEHGTYQLISSPIQGIQPSYPPGLPFLLSILLKVFSFKTEELWLLKGLSIAAMNFLGLGVFVYGRKIKEYSSLVSWLLAMIVILSPAFVFLATSTVMSECVFTCFQLWAVVHLEKSLKNNEVTYSTMSTMSGLACACFYTRSIGITLIAAVAIRLWRQVGWQRAAIFVFFCAVIIAPWFMYCQVAYPNQASKLKHGGNIVESYGEQVSMKIAGVETVGMANPIEYVTRVTNNFRAILERDIIGIFLPAALRGEAKSGEEVLGLGGNNSKVIFAPQAIFLSLLLSIFIIGGFIKRSLKEFTTSEFLVLITIPFILIWPWSTFRFILPLTPFLLGYWVDGVQAFSGWLSKRVGKEIEVDALVRVSFCCILFFFALEHMRYIALLRNKPEEIVWVRGAKYVDEVCFWMRDHLPVNSVIASTNSAKVFLLTNHQSVASDMSGAGWEYWRESGIRYMAVLRVEKPGPMSDSPEKYPLVYKTATRPSFYVIDLGEHTKRDSWEEMGKWWDNYFDRKVGIIPSV